jgi:hypothetical protein
MSKPTLPGALPLFQPQPQPRYGKPHCTVTHSTGTGHFKPQQPDVKPAGSSDLSNVTFSGGDASINCQEMKPEDALQLYQQLNQMDGGSRTPDSFTPRKK